MSDEQHDYVNWDHCDDCFRQFLADPEGWDLAFWEVELADDEATP